MQQHRTAIVDSNAEVAGDVEIGPCAVIERDVRIGEGCIIGPHAVIHAYTTLGPGCRVHAGAVLGDAPQEGSFSGCRSYVEIGRDCILREGFTVHRGTEEESSTEIGDGCFMMANSHVGHNCKVGDGVIMANGALLGGRVEIGDGVFLSGNTAVHQFVKVGRLAMLAGLSGASKDVPPFCTIHGATINQVAGMNVVGMRRAGITLDERNQLKRVFKRVCASDVNVGQALAEFEGRELSGPARQFVDFVKASKRGICRMPLV